jgi:hypothetical protein
LQKIPEWVVVELTLELTQGGMIQEIQGTSWVYLLHLVTALTLLTSTFTICHTRGLSLTYYVCA